jgi:hypothetical protein
MQRVLYILNDPIHQETQPNGRTRVWGYIGAIDQYLRIIIDVDDRTVITAHPDRNLKRRMEGHEN